ncbi:BREX-1 system adenine-specific DNA-methyltransferase PglX [Methanobrevibacter smithii]|jgi:Eco57I restriction endonuclease.|uniref:site-specific DNA-methyltransferase (adenine-specific) n=1 Tax=Methanobrevibacter smithii (strain ATCC 35061 / DSM 861 / OCM 144 / PS) TaxID=420247 RepID=A5UP24_METS3|nr:BREX-1 system adenine-specific DNA-methyltransferase PglX [Methanobrevibacter smithii]ABQ87952.1 predicted type II restriction enzyme, methylase subunit [Methanobrevibacter smithii ATCC 35061]
MDKTAIKTFAINSRKKLMEDVEYKMSLVGIDKDNIYEPISSANGIETYQLGGSTNSIYDNDISKRERLVKEVKQKGFENVVEEVAYTWFNRIIAIRFMEINNFLPTKTRVLSSETAGKIEPDIITEAFDVDLDYTQEDKELIFKLKDENKLDELFRFLFIKQCNKLNEILPGLFEKTDDYLELLLNISFTNEDGVVRQLIDTIPEKDFESQVEVIGWLYQFYNTELKDETFANLKKRIKISKERIPAATQLFTPDWIVKYMVENSVGRLWLEGHPNNELKSKWKYYVDEAKQEPEVEQQLITIRKESEILKPEDITVIDPCMGSGHILVYVFEVLMDIYVSEGFTEKDACESILKNNIYGLDIDKRAYQLAYFAVLMKARKYNRRILTKGISPLLCSIEETNSISKEFIEELISQDRTIEDAFNYLISSFKNGKEFGSILTIKPIDFEKINNLISKFESNNNLTKLKYLDEINLLKNIINQSILLSKKYDVVVTNPPYMGNNGMNPNLKDYIKSKFPLTKTDLFAVFLEKGLEMIKDYGFNCMVTMQSWMFLSSFEKFRKKLIETTTISNLLHMDNMVMKIAFGTSATVFRKINLMNYNSTFYHVKLSDVENDIVNPLFFNDKNKYIIKQFNFDKIPGSPIAYWIDDNLIACFNNTNLSSLGDIKVGLQTGENTRFLRYWWEVDFNNIGFSSINCEDSKNTNKKWFPYNKGGSFRKWWGNQEFIINWENDGEELRNFKKSVLRNSQFYFHQSLSWSKISSGKIAFRYYPNGFLFDVAGCSVFVDDYLNYIFGFLNSNVCGNILDLISPTLNYEIGHIASLPIIIDENKVEEINNIVLENIKICKDDWDDYETSWNFKKHPLLKFNENNLKNSFKSWESYKKEQFNQLKSNETKLNNIFSEIYDIDSNYNVEDKHVSINSSNYEMDIKSFVSYAIGCMFGRYSLDDDCLISTNSNFNIENYSRFIPDDDNIIPILDTEYFEDDMVGRFVEFVKICFGEETLEENLEFIANALIKNNKTSREKIREYLLKHFFNDHKKLYKKCPIYWQFSSGSNNAFNCLIYSHRIDSQIIARIRTEYLHKTQKAIEQRLLDCENLLNTSDSSSEKAIITKEKNKLIKQLEETIGYDEALNHVSNLNLSFNLDDGIKENYSMLQDIIISREGMKNKKINLLKKI